MSYRVVVWGTGNVGRPAIRAVLSHRDLELVGVVVSNPDKVGRDAGELAGVAPCGVLATDDWQQCVSTNKPDAVLYSANADTRGMEAFIDLLGLIGAGVNVVSPAFYPLLYPACGLPEAVQPVADACQKAGKSVFVSGIDPGWALDILPVLLSGVVSDISEIRVREIFNYATYDQPEVVRDIVGFGTSMTEAPPMLAESALRTVWEPMLRIVAEALELTVDDITVHTERLPLEASIDVPGMGHFEAGTQGALRFELRALVGGQPRLVVEHVTRIDDACAPDWPRPPEGQGCHQVVISGTPQLVVSLHGHDPVEPGPAGGGNATAANRLVNAIPAVCEAAPGILTPLDLPAIHGGAQVRG